MSYVPVLEGVNVQVGLIAFGTAAPLTYHWQEYGDVPLETLEVNCFDWPASIVTEVGEILTESAVLTVTLAMLDFAFLLVLSVTFRYTVHEPEDVGVKIQVGFVAPGIEALLRYHW
jgi:hypothetical protein